MPRAAERGWLAVVAVLGVCAAAGGGAGCGKVTPDPVPDGSTDVVVTVADACMRQSQAMCDALGACAEAYVQFLYGDKATCVSRALRTCMDEQGAMGITRTPADMAACAEAVSRASCADLVASKLPAACDLKPGTLVNGLACGSDLQCQSSYCAKRNSDCGTCGPRVGVGGDCMADAGCQAGLRCANSKCVMPGDLGAACRDGELPCRSDLYCPGTAKCTPKLGVGGACSDAFFSACDLTQGLVCNLFQCIKVTVSKGGGTCGGGSQSICMGLNPCLNEMTNVPGTCAYPAGDGEVCGSGAMDRKCLPPASCMGGLCRLPSVPSCR